MNKDKRIVIDIDNLRARKVHINNRNTTYEYSHHFFLEKYAKDLSKCIFTRIDEIEDKGFKEFFEYKMHDSILIYGTRGNGKTTIMMNLKEILDIYTKDKKIENDIKILEIIDPTLLEDDEDFLLVILKNIYNEIININSSKYDSDKRDFERNLEVILEQIEGTRVSEMSVGVFDKFYGNKSGVGLAKAIHKLFHLATKIFDVKTLILPVDDIDMNMYQGYKITETIRKYLASPYVIPIVSFNLKQMNMIIRKNKYQAFGLDILNDDFEQIKDLDFLLSLPSDYLTAIFPPNRRIYLESIYNILLKEFKENKEILLKTSKHEDVLNFFYKDSKSINEKNIINIEIVLNIFINLVYERYMINRTLSKRIADYLSNRSIRDFMYDMLSTIDSFKVKENNELISIQKLLIDRFSPENQNLLINKEQALVALWQDFLNLAKKNIANNNIYKSDIKNNWAKEIIAVSYDDYTELVNKKTYRRLWLQRYYYQEQSIIHNEGNSIIVKKQLSISGFLELSLRSFIPMFLFQEIVSRKRLGYSLYDIVRLKEMATADLVDVAYHISVMELFLKQSKYNDKELREKAKFFGSIHVNYRREELYKNQYNIPFLFKLRKQDLFFDIDKEGSEQIYFFSIFKAIALFIDTLKKYESMDDDREDKSIKKVFEQYRINLPCENDDKFVQKFFTESEKYNNIYEKLKSIELNDSEFGIIECMNFSKRLIKYFYNIRSNTNLKDNFASLNFKTNSWKIKEHCKYEIIENNKEEKTYDNVLGTLSDYCMYPMSTYISGFMQSILISLVKTQPNIRDLDIYTINSIHGANLSILKEPYTLSKQSNAFIANINSIYTWCQECEKNNESTKCCDFAKILELNDGITYNKNQINDKFKGCANLKQIIEFYNNLLSIEYFSELVKKFNNLKPTEDCEFTCKDKTDGDQNNASKN